MDTSSPPDPRCNADDLVARMREGDVGALEQITYCYGERLIAVGRRYCRDEEAARDAVQDAILTAGMKLADFRGEGSVEGWLVTMVANYCRRMQRGDKNDPSLHVPLDPEVHGGVGASATAATGASGPGPAAEHTPEEQTARGELLRIIGKALLELEPRDRVMILLSDAEGWKAPEIAKSLEMTPAAVRTRLSRARKRLREHLGPLRDFFRD